MAIRKGYASISNGVSILKEIYSPPWYHVKGVRKELISRIKALSPVEKALLGIEEEGDNKNELPVNTSDSETVR